MKRVIYDLGFMISDLGTWRRPVTGQPRAQSEIRNQKSETRSGISLTEVLISMGILVIGLLSVMAMLPAGGKYMQQGEVADRGTAIAQAAFADLVTQGMLNPAAWIAMVENPRLNWPLSPPTTTLDGNVRTYTRRVAPVLAEMLAKTATAPNETRQPLLAKKFGSAFVIDPMGVAGIVNNPSDSSRYQYYEISTVPAFRAYGAMFAEDQIAVKPAPAWTSQWQTWAGSWPVRRVTFAAPPYTALPTPPRTMNPIVASYFFTGRGDPAFSFPDSADEPANQLWDVADFDPSGGRDLGPTARQNRGDYSWFATVAPTSTAARDALAQGGGGHYYDVTVVVFYKRVLSRRTPLADEEDINRARDLLASQERCVTAKVLSTGLSGGELLLTRYANPSYDQTAETPFRQLKTGQWLMLCGPHPLSTDRTPMFVLNWYRVLSIEGEGEYLNDVGQPTSDPTQTDRRVVALRGPQWPWQPHTDLTSPVLSNDLRVGIFPGAVAVHNRKIRLQGSGSGSLGWGDGGVGSEGGSEGKGWELN